MLDKMLILREFDIPKKDFIIQPFGNGHINDTYLILNQSKEYILQKINKQVFHEPEKLMDNLVKITKHMMKKQPDEANIRFFNTRSGYSYVLDDEGNYWRLMNFIHESISYDLVSSPKIAFEGGKAFGRFQKILSDFPAEELNEVIPDFHHMGKRLRQFDEAFEKDVLNRSSKVANLIALINKRREGMNRLIELKDQGVLKCHVTHNDTKINNVLINKKTGRSICVIDLDTVMPGLVHYDFGDAVRTGTNTGLEDDRDLDAVGIDLDLFKGLVSGYLSEAYAFLSEDDLEYLAFSAKAMVFIIGLRFLTDYLKGDVYYKTLYDDHNKQRAAAQFRLLESMERNFDRMNDIVISVKKSIKKA